MAIQFQKEEIKQNKKVVDTEIDTQIESVSNDENQTKIVFTKIKRTPLQKWALTLLVLSILATAYVVLFQISPFIVMLPAIVLWMIWFCIVAVATVCTVGFIWLNDGWKSFNKSFMDFNSGAWNFFVDCANFTFKLFPYIASVLALVSIASFVVSLVGYKQQKAKNVNQKFKSKLIISIICLCLFVVFVVLDIIFFKNSDMKIV